MKRRNLFIILAAALMVFTSCEMISFEPYNVLPGTYVHKVTGATVTDLMIDFRKDGTCRFVMYDGYTKIRDEETTYTSDYTSFSYDLVTGTVAIKDVGAFEFRWFSDRKKFQKMELIDVKENKKYTMVYGEVSEK